MTRHVRVQCDGRRCRTESTTLNLAMTRGWSLTDDVDLCPRCAAGGCSGTVGSRPSWMSPGQYDPCPCRLPLGHDGDCKCSHDLADDDLPDILDVADAAHRALGHREASPSDSERGS